MTLGKPDLSNPRVKRTHDHVLSVARQMLLEGGRPSALTYSGLAERAGVTRQTLYRHWPTLEVLFVELVLSGPRPTNLEPGRGGRAVLVGFLAAMRDRFNDSSTAATLLTVAAQAAVDGVAADALARVSSQRRELLNALLEPSGIHVGQDDFARLAGPVFYRMLHSHGEVPTRFIVDTVDGWLQVRKDGAVEPLAPGPTDADAPPG